MEMHGPSKARKVFGGDANKSLIVAYESHWATHRYLSSALEGASGIAVLQGPRGAGKTTIVNELLPQLKRECSIALFDGSISASKPHVSDVLSQFGFDELAEKDDQMLQMLSAYAMQEADSGRAPVLIIDNADRLEPSVLSLLNWLAALDVRGRWAIRFVLTGRERLAELVADYSMRHFERRHPAVFHMNPLSKREAVIYLRTKFIVAGGNNAEDVLSLDVCEELHEKARGWPGRLDELAIQRAICTEENRGSPSGPRIIVIDEGKTVADYAVTKSEIIIGRDHTADIVIDDAYVSKWHATLKFDDSAVKLFDLNSTNGTRVNSTDTMHSVLSNNDIVSIGKYRLRIENLPAASDEMARAIRRADTLTLENPDDVRRLRAKRNIRRSRTDKEFSEGPKLPRSYHPVELWKSAT